MANYWKQPGIPHKGWTLIDVVDIRHDGQEEWETAYETCMMCDNDKIRYVHILTHPDVREAFRVGCTCAEKMTDDYVNPGRREKELRNKAIRRANWVRRKWKRSKNGNLYLQIDGHHLLVFQDDRTKKYRIKIGETFGKKYFDTLAKAKAAVFEGIEYYKEKGEW